MCRSWSDEIDCVAAVVLAADRAAHHSFKDEFFTTNMKAFDAISESANARDRRRVSHLYPFIYALL